MKTVQNMAGPKRSAGTCKMGIHKNAYSLYSGPASGRRKGKVTVTVNPEAVALAFASSRDTNASRTATVVTTRPDQIRPTNTYRDPQAYSLVILPNSKSIQR